MWVRSCYQNQHIFGLAAAQGYPCMVCPCRWPFLLDNNVQLAGGGSSGAICEQIIVEFLVSLHSFVA